MLIYFQTLCYEYDVAHSVTNDVEEYQQLLSTVEIKTVGTLYQHVTLFTWTIFGIFVFGIHPDKRTILHIMCDLSER
jgi:hypothetical protein